MPSILISTSSFATVAKDPLERLREAGIAYRLNPYGRRLRGDETVELLAGADGLIAGTEELGRGVLASAPRLKVVSRCGAGLENVDLDAARDLGIRVFSTPDAHVDAVAELALGAMLALGRGLLGADADLRAGRWRKPMGRLLRGRTVGVVGLGRVGKAVVRLLAPFGAEILAVDPAPDETFAGRHRVAFVSLTELLERSDVVSLHLPLSAATRGLLGAAELARMKPNAVLVNCARGGLVDEEALGRALAAGRLGGAHLDVFADEPYVGPLTAAPNTLLTPHIGSYAGECRLAMEMQAVESLIGFFREAAA